MEPNRSRSQKNVVRAERRGALAVLLTCALAACSSRAVERKDPDPAVYLQAEFWRRQALTEIIPFWEKTIDAEHGGFFNDVMVDGTVNPEVGKYPRMVSRTVYGFSVAYLLSGDERWLKLARHGLDWLKRYGWDTKNGGWRLYLDKDNQIDDGSVDRPFEHPFGNPDRKNLFDQTYGNLGPTLYYVATHDRRALGYVEKTHRLIQEKAWDPLYQGYFAEVNLDWSRSISAKSFNAQIDTCAAYLIYYYLATRDPKLLAELDRIGQVIADRMVDPATGYVGETFTGNWSSMDPTLWVGHNLKTAWVLLRLHQLTGNARYAELAQMIAKVQSEKGWDDRYGGWRFWFQDQRLTSAYDKDRKEWWTPAAEIRDWWTQTEGNFLMLNLYRLTGRPEYLKTFQRTAVLWDRHLVDHEHGDVFEQVQPNGEPAKMQKGHLYKSAYHVMEHALFNYLYLSFWVEKRDAELHFLLSAERAGEKHAVKLVEDPNVILKRVEIDGKEWKQFDSKEGTITLPKGQAMKVRVVLGVAGS